MPRIWHTSALVESKVVVHGGRTKDYSEKSKQRLASVVETFDLYTELWEQRDVTGEAPAAGIHSAACASVNGDLFQFGGFDGPSLSHCLRVQNPRKVVDENRPVVHSLLLGSTS